MSLCHTNLLLVMSIVSPNHELACFTVIVTEFLPSNEGAFLQNTFLED